MQISALYIILASTIWGLDGFVRQSTPIDGNLLLALESTIAGIILLLFIYAFRRPDIRKVQNMKSLIGTIVIGGVGGGWCFVHALATTTSLGFVFVLIGLQPIFTIFSSALLLGEHPRASFYAFAATTIFASILLTVGDTGFQLDSAALQSYVYALLAGAFWGTSTTLSKIVIMHNSNLYTLGLRFFFTGMIGWVIVAFSGNLLAAGDVAQKVIASPLNIIFLIFISDILASGIYLRGLKNIPATIATIFELTFPLTGFVLDYIIYDTVPSPMKVVAALTILMSIVILPHCHFIEENQKIQQVAVQ